ncbi:hypothetical protein BH11BAC1_BH11BAC1_12640 [soil metagenome]
MVFWRIKFSKHIAHIGKPIRLFYVAYVVQVLSDMVFWRIKSLEHIVHIGKPIRLFYVAYVVQVLSDMVFWKIKSLEHIVHIEKTNQAVLLCLSAARSLNPQTLAIENY